MKTSACPSSYGQYKKTMAVNFQTAVRTTLSAIEHLKKTDGNIVFVSSVASERATLSGYAYASSKAALTMFMKSMAIELSPSIRVNSVAPGPVRTPIFSKIGVDLDKTLKQFNATTLLDRIAAPEEVAKAIFYLTSGDATFITGTELTIDGGYLLQTGWTSMEKAVKVNLELQASEQSSS